MVLLLLLLFCLLSWYFYTMVPVWYYTVSTIGPATILASPIYHILCAMSHVPYTLCHISCVPPTCAHHPFSHPISFANITFWCSTCWWCITLHLSDVLGVTFSSLPIYPVPVLVYLCWLLRLDLDEPRGLIRGMVCQFRMTCSPSLVFVCPNFFLASAAAACSFGERPCLIIVLITSDHSMCYIVWYLDNM